MVHEVFLSLQILDNLAINLDVLQASVKNDKNLSCDSPVVEVRNVALKNELQ